MYKILKRVGLTPLIKVTICFLIYNRENHSNSNNILGIIGDHNIADPINLFSLYVTSI